jgi:hypothetical protein
LLLLLAIGGGWLALAPLLAGAPPTPSPTTPLDGTVGIVAAATLDAPTAADRPPTAAPPASATSAPATAAPPSASPSPATPTATPLPSCNIVDQSVNLRAGPGTVYPLLTSSLISNTLLTPLARSPSGDWINVRIQATGRRGWVIADPALVDCNVAVESLPIGAVPPRPTPRPTATATPIPTETAAPTALPVVPIETALPIALPTDTAGPPTPTSPPPIPTARPTLTDTPTPTSPPPTATPTATPTPRAPPTPCSACPPTATPG